MVTEVMGKIKALWRRDVNDARNGASLAAIRVEMGPRQTVIGFPRFSQNFRKILGNPCLSKMAPFGSLSRMIAEILGEINALWRRVEMVPKWGILLCD